MKVNYDVYYINKENVIEMQQHSETFTACETEEFINRLKANGIVRRTGNGAGTVIPWHRVVQIDFGCSS